MNLTRRFSLTHGFIALLAVTVTLVVILGAAYHFFEDEIRQSQESRMKAFTLAAQESYFANDDMSVLDFIRLAVKDPLVVFAAFTDTKGKTSVLPAAFQATNPAQGSHVLTDGRRIKVLSSAVTAGGKTVGTAVLTYDTDKVQALVQTQVKRWVGLAGLAGACALMIALIVSVLLSQTLVKPLRRIKAGTELVRAGKLDKLVEVDRADEIGALARSFDEMVVQLKELETMKRDFVAGVTHDFGTPLHAMQNAIELLSEEKAGPLTPGQSEYLLLLTNNLAQLGSFIENLLTSARIEAAKAEPFYEPIDALALTREIVALYQPEALKKGIDLQLLNGEDTLALVTDATMFRQILTNLVSNAMKYTLKGGVSVRLSRDNRFSTLQVTDTGIGVDPKHHQMIFDRFFRVRQGKNFPIQPGTGLGLSIAKGLAEAMGGSILLESQPGKGSTFSVKLLQRSPSFPNELPPPQENGADDTQAPKTNGFQDSRKESGQASENPSISTDGKSPAGTVQSKRSGNLQLHTKNPRTPSAHQHRHG